MIQATELAHYSPEELAWLRVCGPEELDCPGQHEGHVALGLFADQFPGFSEREAISEAYGAALRQAQEATTPRVLCALDEITKDLAAGKLQAMGTNLKTGEIEPIPPVAFDRRAVSFAWDLAAGDGHNDLIPSDPIARDRNGQQPHPGWSDVQITIEKAQNDLGDSVRIEPAPETLTPGTPKAAAGTQQSGTAAQPAKRGPKPRRSEEMKRRIMDDITNNRITLAGLKFMSDKEMVRRKYGEGLHPSTRSAVRRKLVAEMDSQ
jgi:hypothetical protein